MMARVMLTTLDNPHSPFDNYKAWLNFDIGAGYHTSDYLARIVQDAGSLSDQDLEVAIEQAIDEIIYENVLGIYIKVTKDD